MQGGINNIKKYNPNLYEYADKLRFNSSDGTLLRPGSPSYENGKPVVFNFTFKDLDNIKRQDETKTGGKYQTSAEGYNAIVEMTNLKRILSAEFIDKSEGTIRITIKGVETPIETDLKNLDNVVGELSSNKELVNNLKAEFILGRVVMNATNTDVDAVFNISIDDFLNYSDFLSIDKNNEELNIGRAGAHEIGHVKGESDSVNNLIKTTILGSLYPEAVGHAKGSPSGDEANKQEKVYKDNN